jgi:uncharacterized membrane protein YfcA
VASVSAPELLLLVGAGLVAGTASAMAGGASLLTFPVLLALGLPPLSANVTNTTGLVPTSVGAALASREELAGRGRRLLFLTPPAVLGALVGAGTLLIAPPGIFEAIVPFLIAGSSVLLLLQPAIVRRAGERLAARQDRGAWLGALAASVYAGYFGAAAAVLFMALVGLFSNESIHELNAMKNVLIGVANGVAAVTFTLAAPVQWSAVAALALGCLAGGAAGVRLARRIPPQPLRWGIAAVGLAVAVWLLVD